MALPNPNITFAPFDQLPAAKLTDIVENTEALAAGTGLNDGALANAKLATGAGQPGGAWTSWTPTWTNVTASNATVDAKWTKVGRTVHFRISFLFGSGSSISGRMIFSLPTPAVTYPGGADTYPIGIARILDSGTAAFAAYVEWASSTTAVIQVEGAGGNTVNLADTSATVPMVWATGDIMAATGTYEAAA